MNLKAPRRLLIKEVREQGRDTRSFHTLPEGEQTQHNLRFLPGQVAVLRIKDEPPGYFALASAPEDCKLEFLVKRREGSSQAIYDLQPGNTVELVEIVGHGFRLEEHQGKDLVMVAMGTGIAPLRSVLRHVLMRPDDFGQIVLLYGARTPDAFSYLNEVEAWQAAGIELRQVISRPDGYDWAGSTGYVQSLLDNVLPNLSAPVALVCGSREMIEATSNRLQEMGFDPEDILTNY